MNRLLDSLATHWLPAALLAVALVALALVGLLRRRLGARSYALAVLAGGAGVAALGGLLLPPLYGFWLGNAAVLVLAVMALVLVLSGAWWRPLAWAVAAVALFALGSSWLGWLGQVLAEGGRR